jgi:HNH endonuclease
VSITHIAASLRREIVERAGSRCECCLLPSTMGFFPHEIDHVIAEKHGGKTDPDNLAYSCWRCNRYKGTDLGSFDPKTNNFSQLFNPRTQVWTEHFEFDGEEIVGLTPEGRTTVRLLQMNSVDRLVERAALAK